MTESLASKAPFDPRSRWNARRGRKPQDYDYYSHLNVTTTTNYANAYTPILDEVIPTTNGFISSLRDNITTIASNPSTTTTTTTQHFAKNIATTNIAHTSVNEDTFKTPILNRTRAMDWRTRRRARMLAQVDCKLKLDTNHQEKLESPELKLEVVCTLHESNLSQDVVSGLNGRDPELHAIEQSAKTPGEFLLREKTLEVSHDINNEDENDNQVDDIAPADDVGSRADVFGSNTERVDILADGSTEIFAHGIVTDAIPQGSPSKDAIKPKWKRFLGNAFRKHPRKLTGTGSEHVCTAVATQSINDEVQSNGQMKGTTAQKWSKFGNALRKPFVKKRITKGTTELAASENTKAASPLQVKKRSRNLFRRKVRASKSAPHYDTSSDADVGSESNKEGEHEPETVDHAETPNGNVAECVPVVEDTLFGVANLNLFFREQCDNPYWPYNYEGDAPANDVEAAPTSAAKDVPDKSKSKKHKKKRRGKKSSSKSKASSVTELESTAGNSVTENASSSGAQAERRAADLAPLNSDAGPYAVNENSPMRAIDYGYEETPTVTSIDSEPSIDEPIVATEDNNEVGEDVPRATSWESIRLSRLSDQAAGIAGCHRMETKTQRFKQKIQALGKLFAYAFHFKSRSSIVENADDNDRDVGRGTVSPEQNENAALEQPCIKKKKKVSRIVNWKQKIQHRLKKLTKIGAAAGYEIDTSVDWETYIATFRADRATYIAALRDFCQRQ